MSLTFQEFLVKRANEVHEEILRSMMPSQDTSVGTQTGNWEPDWWMSREKVRKIIEQERFVSSKSSGEFPHDYDNRFEEHFPDLNEAWEKMSPEERASIRGQLQPL